jgi:site-specific DNA-methyltransferase (adenine-specific)
MPGNSVDCVISSPPYWQLRDYHVNGQLGLEPTFQEYIQRLCDVFDEARRVLKPAGTCWINMGDTYASQGARNEGFNERWHGRPFRSHKQAAADPERPHGPKTQLPKKSLVMIPFRFAVEMVNRGWILRNTIIWHKPNCLPSSAKDRFTIDFEYLFFFTKSKQYFFQPQHEPHSPSTKRRVRSFHRNRERFDPGRHKADTDGPSPFEILQRISRNGLNPRGRNKRCVWTIPVRGFRGQHFATFPEQLVEAPIRAGCPPGGLVCDPFFGSGTTGVAAGRLGRHFVGIELNPKYVRLARQRLAKAVTKSD